MGLSIGSRRPFSQSGMTLTGGPGRPGTLSGGPDARDAALVGSSDDHGKAQATRFRLDERALHLPDGLVRAGRRPRRRRRGRRRRAATSASTPTSCASPSWCSPSPTASARCSTSSGWALLPDEDPAAPPPDGPAADAPSGPSGVGLLTLGAVLLFGRAGLVLPPGVVWAVVLSAIGFGLVWARTDEEDRTRGLLLASRRRRRAARRGARRRCSRRAACCPPSAASAWSSSPPASGWRCCSGPWIVRLWRDLGTERRERIRSEERSEIAAHLHDSVLQTLALIQRAEAPGRARTLARRQERELRAWLFDERPPDGDGDVTTLSAALERVVTDVEDRHDIEVDLVLVGDCRDGRSARGPRGRGARGGPQRRPPRRGARGEPSTSRSSPTGSRPTSATAARASTSTRSSPAGSACGSRSSGAWPATAAGPRSTPRPARAPRSSSRCRAP